MDANAVVGNDGTDDDVVGDDAAGVRDEEGKRLVLWAREAGLILSSTCALDPACQSPITKIPDEAHATFVVPRQLDYILADRRTHEYRHTNIMIDTTLNDHIGSDHHLVTCTYSFAKENKIPFDEMMASAWARPKRQVTARSLGAIPL